MKNGLLASVVMILIGVGLLYNSLGQIYDEPIKVGLVVELTGDIPAVGLSSQRGAQLAAAEINKNGGLKIGKKKHKIELIINDNKGKVEDTVAAIEKLIKEDKVMAIVGPNASRFAIPAALVAEQEKTVLISPWSTNPQTTIKLDGQPKQYVFRTAYTDPFQGRVLAKYTLGELKKTKAAIITDSTAEVLVGQATYFRDTFKATGGQIVLEESFKAGDKSLVSQLQKIKLANPEIIFLPAYYNDAARIIKQAHTLGIETPFLGSDAWGNSEILSSCGEDCNGYFLTAHYAADSTNSLTKNFVQAFKSNYDNAIPDDVAALTYDSINLIAKALTNVDVINREAVRSGLSSVKDFNGVTGSMTFDGVSGDPVKGAVILEIKDGKMIWYADARP